MSKQVCVITGAGGVLCSAFAKDMAKLAASLAKVDDDFSITVSEECDYEGVDAEGKCPVCGVDNSQIIEMEVNADGTISDGYKHNVVANYGGTSFDSSDIVAVGDRNAVNFDGTFGYTINTNYDIKKGYTFEMVLKIDDTDDSSYKYLADNQNSGGFALYYQNGKIYYEFHVGSGNKTITFDYTKGEWYHVVVTYDGAAQKMYVNGELVGEYATTTLQDKNQPWRYIGIGGTSHHSPFKAGTVGQIAEVNLYTYVANATKVTELYNANKIVVATE